MARAQTQWIGAGVIALAAIVTFKWLGESHREVKEPDPKSVSKVNLEAELSTGRVQVRIDELFYVNRDFNAFIFTGRVKPVEPSKVNLSFQELLPSEEYRSIYPSTFGEVRRFTTVNKTLWGIVVSTTSGEWDQGRERFLERWELAKQNL